MTYFKRLAVSVSAAIMHWWPENDPAASRYTRVTFLSDYALWTMSKFARWGNLQDYEYMSPRPALQRGFGFCSQMSKVVFSVLVDNGFRPVLINHEEHTVIEVNGTMIDSDYGVFIPFSLDDLQEKPHLVGFYYRNFPRQQRILDRVFRDGLRAALPDRVSGRRAEIRAERPVSEVADPDRPDGALRLADPGESRAEDKGGARANERAASDSRSVGAAPLMEQAGINC